MININLLAGIYLILSVILFLYSMKSYRNSLKSYLYAIALNVFPLIYIGYLGNENTRLFRIPIAYFPLIASFFSSLVISRSKILRKEKFLFFIYLTLLFYLFVQSFLIIKIQNYASFLEYYFMWVVNIFLMFTVSYITYHINYKILLDILKKLVLLITISSLIGILKYLMRLQYDANFMPMMVRNGTAYIIVMVTPILLFLRDTRVLKSYIFISSVILYFICLLLIKSRMGLIGFMFAFIIYYVYKYKFQLHKLIPFLLLFIFTFVVMLYSPIGKSSQERLKRTLVSAQLVLSGEGLTPEMGDYARFQLILYGIEIIKKNFWFGTGVGLENYRIKLGELNPIRESKPHNFYVSYLAEFGMIGFSILMILLLMVWRRFSRIGISKTLSYAFNTIFITVMFMLFMNEYITYPFTWFIWGIGLGLSYVKTGEINETL